MNLSGLVFLDFQTLHFKEAGFFQSFFVGHNKNMDMVGA